jgi:hypothetical protein
MKTKRAFLAFVALALSNCGCQLYFRAPGVRWNLSVCDGLLHGKDSHFDDTRVIPPSDTLSSQAPPSEKVKPEPKKNRFSTDEHAPEASSISPAAASSGDLPLSAKVPAICGNCANGSPLANGAQESRPLRTPVVNFFKAVRELSAKKTQAPFESGPGKAQSSNLKILPEANSNSLPRELLPCFHVPQAKAESEPVKSWNNEPPVKEIIEKSAPFNYEILQPPDATRPPSVVAFDPPMETGVEVLPIKLNSSYRESTNVSAPPAPTNHCLQNRTTDLPTYVSSGYVTLPLPTNK